MHVVRLTEIDASMIDTVGGKAAGLGEMVAMGERVPPGFCLTTAAHEAGTVPEDALRAAYGELGGGPVAVRSSATAEDLPDASFAGQQDTLLDVRGESELSDAVRHCWDSLDSDRAIAYREANVIEREGVRMAVVVQRMVDARVAGVLFTADPLTGSRSRMVVDAAPGLGTAVVDGSVTPDHYVLEGSTPVTAPPDGCLDPAQLEELWEAGHRLQKHFGSPQDVEWAIDGEGVLWLLQSRPITTLFPLPPRSDKPGPRLYLEFGHIQGMLRPFTPMGSDMMLTVSNRWFEKSGGTAGPDVDSMLTSVGGRLYMDLTDFMRSTWTRSSLPEGLRVYGPRVQASVGHMLEDPRFSPLPGPPPGLSAALPIVLRLLLPSTIGLAGAIARPRLARARAARGVREFRNQAEPDASATAAERLRFVTEDALAPVLGRAMMDVVTATMAGLVVGMTPSSLLKGIATDEELDQVLGGMPHNVTTEMDLALSRLAENAAEHRALLMTTDPADLAAMYRNGRLPDIGLEAFLADYGHRAAAEVDLGMPRWEEDPAPLFATIANYLRLDDPDQAPARRFRRSAVRAEAKIDELAMRGRALRPVRGRVATFLMRRSRVLTGSRELAKFAWLIPFAAMRRQLLLVGGDLASRGLLDRGDDIMFLEVAEAYSAVHEGVDHRRLVARRRAVHARELRRPSVPSALLSDGTDVEELAPRESAPEGSLAGMAAAGGRATGRARVIRDPAGAHVEPGDILVAPTTDPGWTPLFMTAAGLVTETGSTVAHGPTVAREYGIPAVICVRDATREIVTGQLITIDGSAGTVVFEPEPEPEPEPGRGQSPIGHPV